VLVLAHCGVWIFAWRGGYGCGCLGGAMSCCNNTMPMPFHVPSYVQVRVLATAGASVPHAEGVVVGIDSTLANEWVALGWVERVD